MVHERELVRVEGMMKLIAYRDPCCEGKIAARRGMEEGLIISFPPSLPPRVGALGGILGG